MVIGMPWIWVRVLGSQLSSQIITCETTRVEAVSTELQHIMVLDYDPQESDFLRSVLDFSIEGYCCIRIEEDWLFHPYNKAESCHLISK
ncbi:hypothetical protein KXD40_005967 [Peronospora effusa]|nr:hypothetical protein KXD40_005976 [Peronospora effusa]UIZ25447.1 hypothetical protein KXD40_005977 [Peronospora effusa]UIZ25448.1 hypothetical protein KXD40_005972 [Peronospora effusa]UIZ25449.1 hypothetical protein KXD40_005973 [Peronospora effusa]UIZ25450.1 hypothetical protein KXD40_005970 [Peronospora effusa]